MTTKRKEPIYDFMGRPTVIDRAIDLALSEGREIDDITAREIASLFHDGSTLTLSFASTGYVPADSSDLWRAFFPEFHSLTRQEQRWANWLGTYLVHAPKETKREGWAK